MSDSITSTGNENARAEGGTVAPAPASRWKRLSTGAFIGASHTATVAFSLVFCFVVSYVIFFVAALAQAIGDLLHPVAEMPAGRVLLLLVVGWIVGAIVIAVLTVLVIFLAALMGICADVFRRHYRWPFWVMPFVVAGLNGLVWPLIFMPFPASGGAWQGFKVACGITGLFLFYWLVLFFSEQALLLIKWMFGWIGRSIKKWWKGDPKPKEFPPHEEGI